MTVHFMRAICANIKLVRLNPGQSDNWQVTKSGSDRLPSVSAFKMNFQHSYGDVLIKKTLALCNLKDVTVSMV